MAVDKTPLGRYAEMEETNHEIGLRLRADWNEGNLI